MNAKHGMQVIPAAAMVPPTSCEAVSDPSYQLAEFLTLWAFPDQVDDDSRWQTEDGLPWAERLQ
jgi:hypothetical protein